MKPRSESSNSFLYRLLLFTLLLFAEPGSASSEEVVLRMQDGAQTEVTSLSWDKDSIQFKTASGDLDALPREQLKAISFRRPYSRKVTESIGLQLTNDDIYFVSDLLLTEERFLAKFDDQDISIPIEYVREVFFDVCVTNLKESAVDPGSDDVVILKNQDVVRGELDSFDDDKINFKTDLGSLKLPRSNSRSIKLNPALAADIPIAAKHAQLFLKNGSVLSTMPSTNMNEFDLSKEKLNVELPETGTLSILMSDICRIEFWDERHRLLNRDQPLRSHNEDYFGNIISFSQNRNASGQLLLSGDQFFSHGYGVRSQSELIFAVPSNAEALIYSVGLDDRADKNGAVDVHISLDDVEVSSHRLSQTDSHFLEHSALPIHGQKSLKLSVRFGLRGDVGDCVNWCQPYFLLRE
ncbi:NPCBM/NEW2 domain-containing protein [Thalassoglobus sp.]|uniref:NPCBM/NEW2 domain-containing protein n=1 Tax=Thalassoglobus sp. TaxID=2795869 RepID=UPI003AA978A4